MEEIEDKDCAFEKRARLAAGNPRPGPGKLCFAVIEVCGGWGGITIHCQRRGFCTGPVIELKKGWDQFASGLFFWLLRLCLDGRVWLLFVEPPCTTFSIARNPKLRSKSQPEGFEPCEPEAMQGNLVGILCALLALAQWAVGNYCVYGQPASGYMKDTFWWAMMLQLGFSSIISSFCPYLP